jgi:guanylate cyclase
MESSGQALRIHISAATKELLDRLGGYIIEERGMTPIRVSNSFSTAIIVNQLELIFDHFDRAKVK